jgi:hypothetical protein
VNSTNRDTTPHRPVMCPPPDHLRASALAIHDHRGEHRLVRLEAAKRHRDAEPGTCGMKPAAPQPWRRPPEDWSTVGPTWSFNSPAPQANSSRIADGTGGEGWVVDRRPWSPTDLDTLEVSHPNRSLSDCTVRNLSVRTTDVRSLSGNEDPKSAPWNAQIGQLSRGARTFINAARRSSLLYYPYYIRYLILCQVTR